MRVPIALLCFNRPHYFRRVIASLKAQEGVTIADDDITLFLDGAVNAVSGIRYSEESLLDQSEAIFRDAFPGGRVARAEANLGVALNFERAEKYVFEELDAPVAFFFEDDMELGPYYLATLHRLAKIALDRDDIGHFAAYGNHRATAQQQLDAANEFRALGHNWAFGLTKSQWAKSQPYVQQYLDLVRNVDYRQRPTDAICELMHSWGVGAPGTSQDVCKTLAVYLTGSVKINTTPAFARYIGERGLHTTPVFFEQQKFADTAVATRDIFTRDTIRDDEIDTIRTHLERYCLSEMTPSVKAHAPPIRMTPNEVATLERYLCASKFYLEFGCGGSTMLALQASRGIVVSVESDPKWIAKLKEVPEVTRAAASGRLVFYHADLGPVMDWGIPQDERRIKSWKTYYISPWTFRDFDYDFVLIDGRFRVLCALAAAIFAPAGAVIALHDYGNRPGYYDVERYFDIIEQADKLVFMRRRVSLNMRAWLLDFTNHLYDLH